MGDYECITSCCCVGVDVEQEEGGFRGAELWLSECKRQRGGGRF